MLLAIAVALLIAQGVSAALIYRAQAERREAALVSAAAFRLTGGEGRDRPGPIARGERMGLRVGASSPQFAGEARDTRAEIALADILTREGVAFDRVVVLDRPLARDAYARDWLARNHDRVVRRMHEPPSELVVAALRRTDGQWLSARVVVPPGERRLLRSLLLQALFTYAVLIGAVALVLRRITRPLAALTRRMERFAGTRDGSEPLAVEGPDDVRRLIAAHNALETRIATLLDEKDVMLGAIGHDLKTPLAALRVRIENVEDDAERGKMAATIEDINRSLDDILSLARVGRPSDPLEPTELGALAAAVVEEYEDQGKPVTIAEGPRIVLHARATWLRRGLRNLIDNALRYGQRARVSLVREGGMAVIRIEDDGPGIPADEIVRMLEPFTRLEGSRNSATGGAGLGLTLARAVAEQHGGALRLANRRDGTGLIASVSLPLV
ncbi:HAMP domain-containing protein [Novosphingobium sp. Gsoil 351]|nr:HAMP domain-containing protein [Novosphingobium sp. Gsoil 351]